MKWLFQIPQRYRFSSKSQPIALPILSLCLLFQIPQRYRFSSKSQLVCPIPYNVPRCFRYHKGTDFQANHNLIQQILTTHQLFQIPQRYRFSSKSQLIRLDKFTDNCCFRYHKGTDFQANHNSNYIGSSHKPVVLDTTKVQIFKQITTVGHRMGLQRCCFRYHKGTDFQANHNGSFVTDVKLDVVLDTTKVQIFKQITTQLSFIFQACELFQIPQRYRFSSKSQQSAATNAASTCCFRYHKGTDFQANHNILPSCVALPIVVLDTTKVQIFKQITTAACLTSLNCSLFQIPQRYRFSSKSQQIEDCLG